MTLRHTLAALLAGPLRLRARTRNVLEPVGKEQLERWIRTHLTVVTTPVPRDEELAHVIREMDPPLNQIRAGRSRLRDITRTARRELRSTVR